MQYGTFVAENLWRMELKDCWILLATSKEFHDGGMAMDGENNFFFIHWKWSSILPIVLAELFYRC